MLWTPPLRSSLVGVTGALARGVVLAPSRSYLTLVLCRASSVVLALCRYRMTSCIKKSSLDREGQNNLNLLLRTRQWATSDLVSSAQPDYGVVLAWVECFELLP